MSTKFSNLVFTTLVSVFQETTRPTPTQSIGLWCSRKELQSDYILIYFNNPDCEACETVKQRLAENPLINQMVNDKKLIVLAIYPYDDQKLWKKAKYPKMMINGWNQSRQIEYAELYDLPTLPCFYLLNREHKVLIKNEGSLNKVEAVLKALTTAGEVGPQPAN